MKKCHVNRWDELVVEKMCSNSTSVVGCYQCHVYALEKIEMDHDVTHILDISVPYIFVAVKIASQYVRI